MQTRTTHHGNEATLTLIGRFDFASHRDFRAGYLNALDQKDVRQVILDLAQVEYIDSSALGMLLLLKQRAEETSKTVVLRGAQGTVKQVLDIANFGRLFTLV